jgi:hypothetical protein
MLIRPSKTRLDHGVPRLSRWIVPSSSFCHAAPATNCFVCECLDWAVSSTRQSHRERPPTASRAPVSSQLVCEPNPSPLGWLQELAG